MNTKYKLRQHSIMFIFPGHNYLGLGNPIDNGEPVDIDDFIASQYDINYESATTTDDIRSSDKRTISDLGRDLIRNYNWHSGLGFADITTTIYCTN